MSKINNTVYGPVKRSKLDLMGIRFLADGDTDGAGGDADKGDDKGLGDAGQQAIDRMKGERNTARDEAKAFKALGMSAEDIATLIAKQNDGKAPDEAAIRAAAQKDADTAAAEKFHGKLRGSEVRAQAAELGFIKPSQALALLDAADLADVDVNDKDDVDAPAVKKLLEKLAAESPHLLKPTDTTPGHTEVGIGGTGSGTKPDVQPGTARMRVAYENTSKK